MDLVKPEVFGLMANGDKQALLGTLQKTSVMGHEAWKTEFKIKRPGVYMFYMQPESYWEPAEDCFNPLYKNRCHSFWRR